MNGNCHFINGIAVTTLISLNIDNIAKLTNTPINDKPAVITCLVLGGILGSIFPDIDNPKSNMGQLAKPVSTIIGAINKLTGRSDYDHRSIFHDIAFSVIGLTLSLLFFPYISGFFIGTLSHIFLDSFTPRGIPFIFGIGHFHIASIPSASKRAIVVSYLFATLLFTMALATKVYF